MCGTARTGRHRVLRWVGFTALVVLAAACGSSGSEDGDVDTDVAAIAISTVAPLPRSDFVADNGYADITLGRSYADLVSKYGDAAFRATDYAPAPLTSYSADGLPQLQLVFMDGVLIQVDVTQPGLPSINGHHEVGDEIDDVVDRYRARIDAGEALAVTCSEGAVIAQARAQYRLVFFNDGSEVTQISSLHREHVVPGEPCTAVDEEPAVEYAEPEPPIRTITVDSFVPDEIAGSPLALRNPSTAHLDDHYAMLWTAATWEFKALEVVEWADTVVQCLYEGDPPAVAAGVYTEGPVRLVVAVAPRRVPTLENLGCALTEIVVDFVCPFCAIQGPAANAYWVDIDGEPYVVAYVTFGGIEDSKLMCETLPYCADTDFTSQPP